MLGCVDDEREESNRLEVQLRAAIEGHLHPYHTANSNITTTSNNSNSSNMNMIKTVASTSLLPMPPYPSSSPHQNSLLSGIPSLNGPDGSGPVPGSVLTADVTAEELRQRCREENDHFQRLLRMANM